MAADAVSSPLPQLTLPPGATVTVYTDAPAAVVGGLAVKVFQRRPPTAASSAVPAPILLPAST